MKRGRMQCKDIPDRPILEMLARSPGVWHTCGYPGSMPSVQDAMPPDTPHLLQQAKMRQLIRRDLCDGCGCGCRGDYEANEKTFEYLSDPKNPEPTEPA